MAKTPIGLGQFSGRVGGVVYAVQAGRQVVRAYQPIVSNPKSTAQSIQRAKGNLVGRISKITPWQMLEGLGDNKFNRRSRYLRLMLLYVTAGQAAGDPSTFNAKLERTKFVFSEGQVIPIFTSTSAAVANSSSVVVNIGPVPGYSAEQRAAQGILMVVVLKNPSLEFEQILYKFLLPSDLASGTTSVTFNHRTEGAYSADWYMAPFETVDGSKLRTRSGVLTSTATSLEAMLEVGNGASPIVWGNSMYYGSASFTPSTAAANKTPTNKE